MINVSMKPAEVQNLSPKIAVIGVGGGGGNAVNNMISSKLEGCDFLVCNTDAQALNSSLCKNKVQLGLSVTGGLGAGSKPEVGQASAEESAQEIARYLDGANMAFITAGMGGGTGTGAAPVIAKLCRERGILTVGVVTKPFHFEGGHRMKSAEAGIEEMQKYVDTLIVIPNQNLFRVASEKTTFAEAFKMADGVLQSGVRGVTDLMMRPGLVNLDFADIRTAMLEMGKAMMGTGEAKGDKRAIEAAEAAINNPLLDDVTMKGARGVIINVTGGYDMTLFEADEACNRIRDEVDPNANIIFGATFDDKMEGTMRVSIVATGIERPAGAGSVGGTQAATYTVATTPAMTTTTGVATTTGGSSTPQPTGTNAGGVSYSSIAGAGTRTQGTAPVTTNTPMPAVATATPGTDTTGHMLEQNFDMFEQGEFAASADGAATGAYAPMHMPVNTALRGTRYNDSFIPPKPAIPAKVAPTTVAAPYHAQPMVAKTQDASTAGTSTGLKLNPPRLPNPEEAGRKAPSLLQRITGGIQQKLEDIRDEYTATRPPLTARGVAPNMTETTDGAVTTTVPASPVQGTLDVGKPSRPATGESELDIPAFLRRQAN